LFLLTSCGGKSGQFRIKGKFTSLQAGTFYVYSPDGGTETLDTIQVVNGEFDYRTACDQPCTYILVYPNMSEQVVFGNSGDVATLDGDANLLRAVKISGSKDNEEMTRFRLANLKLKDEQMAAPVVAFIKSHPESRVSVYLFDRYLLRDEKSDMTVLADLVSRMHRAQPDNGTVNRWSIQVLAAANATLGKSLPPFSVTTLGGKTFSQNDLRGHYSIIGFWASWADESKMAQRMMHRWKNKYGSRLEMFSVSLDIDPVAMKGDARVDSISWTQVCDYRSWDSPMVRLLAVPKLPYLILVDPQLTIKWRGSDTGQLSTVLQHTVK
jgi:hypothetical protein